MIAADAVSTGQCDGKCLIARSPVESCSCSCRGQYHGRLADVDLDSLSVGITPIGSLVGMYFHTLNESCRWCPARQGYVYRQVGGFYLVGYFSFLHGLDEGSRHLVSFDPTLTIFYDHGQTFRDNYDHDLGRRLDHCDIHIAEPTPTGAAVNDLTPDVIDIFGGDES